MALVGKAICGTPVSTLRPPCAGESARSADRFPVKAVSFFPWRNSARRRLHGFGFLAALTKKALRGLKVRSDPVCCGKAFYFSQIATVSGARFPECRYWAFHVNAI